MRLWQEARRQQKWFSMRRNVACNYFKMVADTGRLRIFRNNYMLFAIHLICRDG